MKHPTDAPPGLEGPDVDSDDDRAALDTIFKAGSRARRTGLPRLDNPYAAGCREREEWDAGWAATADIDDDSDTCYQRN